MVRDLEKHIVRVAELEPIARAELADHVRRLVRLGYERGLDEERFWTRVGEEDDAPDTRSIAALLDATGTPVAEWLVTGGAFPYRAVAKGHARAAKMLEMILRAEAVEADQSTSSARSHDTRHVLCDLLLAVEEWLPRANWFTWG